MVGGVTGARGDHVGPPRAITVTNEGSHARGDHDGAARAITFTDESSHLEQSVPM